MLGSRLKQLRNRENLTLAELSKKLGTTSMTLSRYENNQRQPDYETLKTLANYFEVSVDYLLERTEVPNYSLPESKTVHIPIYNLLDSSDSLSSSTLEIVVTSYDYVLDFKNLLAIPVRKNYYEANFKLGDLLIVERTKETNHNSRFYVGKLKGDRFCRIIEYIYGKDSYIFTDADIASRIIFDSDKLEILGRVIQLIRDF